MVVRTSHEPDRAAEINRGQPLYRNGIQESKFLPLDLAQIKQNPEFTARVLIRLHLLQPAASQFQVIQSRFDILSNEIDMTHFSARAGLLFAV